MSHLDFWGARTASPNVFGKHWVFSKLQISNSCDPRICLVFIPSTLMFLCSGFFPMYSGECTVYTALSRWIFNGPPCYILYMVLDLVWPLAKSSPWAATPSLPPTLVTLMSYPTSIKQWRAGEFWAAHSISDETQTLRRGPSKNRFSAGRCLVFRVYHTLCYLRIHIIDGIWMLWMTTSRWHFGHVQLHPLHHLTTTHSVSTLKAQYSNIA